ncbi:MAG: sigma-54-dependent Fis family transcriptional regulator [Deltaproteobacteria bacterium]|nr:sigma-54-dependent Fis family transcriptional regulator [Deltaproteobacteria bacterium]
MRGSVLVVDDDKGAGEVLRESLSLGGFDVRATMFPERVLAMLAERPAEVVLTDLRMGDMDGISLTREILRAHPHTAVVVITAFGSIRTAVDAIRAGAHDFLTKPFDLETVALTLDRAVEHARLLAEVTRLRTALAPAGVGGILGSSPSIGRVHDLVRRVAPLDTGVLITGESGTGKELVARAIHDLSPRAKHPFVATNCAAMPETLIESELFGHVRGAFTDARSDREGLLSRAGKGTLLLDEIGDLPASTQAKLLRVLQERTFRPVGSDREQPLEARVLAATHKDLQGEISAGRFRSDLFFRLQVIEIIVPPLRLRGGDVLLLAGHFVMKTCARMGRPTLEIPPAVGRALLAYDWPGNVRELANAIERAVALASSDALELSDLPDRIARPDRPAREADVELGSLEQAERRHVLRVLEATQGNKRLTAQILEVDRSTLYRMLDRWKEPEGRKPEDVG